MMTQDAIGSRAAPRTGGTLRQYWPWAALLLLAVILPWLFYDWSKGRHAGFIVSLMSQMGMMMVFALSYNMLMGQCGLLTFGHAVLFGLAGYVTAHAMNMVGHHVFWLPQELLPLVGGLAGLGFGIIFGYVATRQRATAFAMITLGLGELVTAAAVMFHGFFGGEGGITTNRMIKTSLLGFTYGPSIQVYYLILAWTVIATAAMALLTQVPLGRMAVACRDNHERAQFVGYDPRIVRFFQFALSGLFAGIAGALYAITYEIVTYDAVNAVMSGNALLMTFIGGIGVFWGPIVGAVLITLLQSWMSLLSTAWMIYVGVLFIIMVMYAPGGIAGLVLAHRPIWRAGRLSALALPYLRLVPAVLVALLGFVGLVELCTFVTVGAEQGKALVLFHTDIDPQAALPWAISGGLLLLGGMLARREGARFAAIWERLGEEIKAAEPKR
jgi:branched-chain amino acid transport system permease protein